MAGVDNGTDSEETIVQNNQQHLKHVSTKVVMN